MIRRSLSFSVLVCSSVVGRALGAAPPERLQLVSDSSCPSATDVARQLAPLLQHTRVSVTGSDAAEEASGDATATVRALIHDTGDGIEVRIGEELRVFRDRERGCAERARSSAVFIGLVLDPPLLPEEPPPSPPSGAAAAVRAPAPSEAKPKTSSYLTLELGPLLQAAPDAAAAQVPLAGGFGSRIVWGSSWGIALGAAFLLPTRLRLPAADARVVWIPFDLSLRLRLGGEELSWSMELGPEAALLFATGDRVQNPRTSTRLELGARGALSASWGMSTHVGAFVTLFSVWRPKPYEFKVNPGVESGTTPAWWLGSALGLSLRTR